MTWIISTPNWQLEKQIKDAWRMYKVRSNDCHVIAQRVSKRKVLGTIYGYPEEIAEYDRKARELREIEGYITVRQKELNMRHPKKSKEDKQFNIQKIEELRKNL